MWLTPMGDCLVRCIARKLGALMSGRRRSAALAALDRTMCVIALVFVALCLCGCPGDSPSPPPTVPLAILDGIVTYFVTRKSLNLRSAMDRHQAFFVRRRAATLGSANPSWISEPNQTTLKARIDAEFDAVRSYVNAKLGTRSTPSTFVRSADTTPHLDLDWAAHMLTTTSASRATTLKNGYVRMRRSWVWVIAWRGAGISDGVWSPTGGGTSATLRTAAMDELVDRRLRICERMHHQVSSAAALESSARLSGTSATGPWTDGFQIRMFEYPRFRVTFAPTIVAAIGAGNIDEWNVSPHAHDWAWEDSRHRRLHWTRGSIRLPLASRPHWNISGYEATMAPAGTGGSSVLDTLFTPSTDWWGRTWMFCDHVVAALQMEALSLGLKRRSGSSAAFDGIVSTHSSGFVKLRHFVGNRMNVLQGGQGDDEWFDNLDISEADLQVGDQLIIWNSFLYQFIAKAEWGLENSVVMDIDSDPNTGTGSIVRSALELQGHGIGQRTYAQYLDEISTHVGAGLASVRASVVAHQSANPGSTSFTFALTGVTVLRWDPYPVDSFTATVSGRGGGAVQGAWWVRIPLSGAGFRDSWSNVDDALSAITKSVKDDPSPGTGYRHPGGGSSTITNAVFFPLFEPAAGWSSYFSFRRTNQTTPVQTRLREVLADGALVPGLFRRSGAPPFGVVRARVRP